MTLDDAIGKSVFLLGAGASYGTGCKMSGEMLIALQEKLQNPEQSNLTYPKAEAIRFLLSCLEYQNKWRSLESKSPFEFSPNIEELALIIRRVKNRENFLPYPLTGNWADKLTQLENLHSLIDEDGIPLFESLEQDLKAKYVPDWLELNADSLDYLNPLSTIMASEDLTGPISLFTLNYDLVIEKFLDQHSCKPYTGFVSGEWRGMNQSEVPEGFDKLNLYKLHGSLDWVRLDNGLVRHIDEIQDEERDHIDQVHNPYIIFGHGTKTFSFDPFFNLISEFKKELDSSTYFFAIGYSFFDPYINNLIIEAINKDPFKKLIIVNPTFGPEDLNLKEEDEFNRYETENDPKASLILSEYIEEIQKNPFYSELPEFNITSISGSDRIHFMKIGFNQYMQEYFSSDGKKLIELVNHYEKIKEHQGNPF